MNKSFLIMEMSTMVPKIEARSYLRHFFEQKFTFYLQDHI